MKFLSILSLSLFLISCGASQLENSDIQTHILSETGIFNTVNQGDSWEDVKSLAGDFWEVREDHENKIYQLRKDIDMSDEMMYVSFQLSNNKVAGIGVDITSVNIGAVGLKLYLIDLMNVYQSKFGVDLEDENRENSSYDGKWYYYSKFDLLDSESPTIGILCMESSNN